MTDYLGCGVLGELAAELDEDERAERREVRRKCQQKIEFDERLDKNVRIATGAIKALTDATLLCHGHHMHKGQWRKTRERGLAC